MKAFIFNDNWAMGRLRRFYDSLVYRRAPLAPEEFTPAGYRVDQKLVDLLELTDADYIIVDSEDSVVTSN